MKPLAPRSEERVNGACSAQDLVPVLRALAAHARTDDHAERWYDTSEGEWKYRRVGQPLSEERLHHHLANGPHLGVYLMKAGTDTTRLALYDLDDHDGTGSWDEMRAGAIRIVDTAQRFGLHAWAVRSGGGRGIHTFFIWDQPQPAKAVRSLLTTVLNAAGFSEGAGGLGKEEVEIFPKQSSVGAGDFGNPIALPFARESVPLDADLRPTEVPTLWRSSAPLADQEEEAAEQGRARSRKDAGAVDTEALRAALGHLSADPYDRWIKYGLALKNSLGDMGFPIWDEWSRTSQNYPDAAVVRKKWDTFKTNRGDDAMTVASIFYEAQLAGWEGATPARTNLPVITIKPGELPRMVDEAEAALLKSDARLFKQGNRILRIILDEGKTAGGGVTSVLRLSQVQPAHLLERFADVAHWQKWDGRAKQMVRRDCPREVVESYLARDGEWALRPLLGVVTAPTLRPDGTVLNEPGYDDATGLVFHARGVEFPPVPEKPSREDALAALARLKEPFAGFPFAPGANLAVALSDVITTVIRRALPVAPMHAYTSPVAGTGKSLAVDIVSMIATGERAAVTTLGRDKYGDAELEKRLVSSLLAADAVISIDNLESPLGGDFLCAMLSQERLRLRPLGRSINVEVSNTFAYHATGNNLTIEGDATRRVLVSRLDAGVERPELRTFSFNALDFARERRGALVAAALTVVRAFLVSGEGQQEPPLGGYEEWSRLVRNPLIWLGEADPVDVMEETRRGDPRLARLREIVAAWHAAIGEREVLVREVVAKAREALPPDQQNPALRKVWTTVI